MQRPVGPHERELQSKGSEGPHGLLAPVSRARPAAAGLIPLARLVEESEGALRAVAADLGAEFCLVARRILETAETRSAWEREHTRIIGRIADQNHRGRQAIATLSHTFTLVHNRSLFEYLRTFSVRSLRRRELMAHFRGKEGYERHVAQEHETWLRSAASQVCLRHLGQNVLKHPAFGPPLTEYEELYRNYFRCYCEWAVPEQPDADNTLLSAQLAELKSAILEKRKALLAMPVV